jgi:hypothetical protein
MCVFHCRQVHHSRVNKKNTKLIFSVTVHPMLPISQESTDVHLPSYNALFLMLYTDLDSCIGRFYTFPNIRNYHEFSFPLNGETMPPRDIRGQVHYLLPSYLHFHPIKI